MELIIYTIVASLIVAFCIAAFNLSQPKYYRIVRNPGSIFWHIQIKRGLYRSTEKEYGGGGEVGSPYLVTAYFNSKEEAEAELKKLVKKEEDKGEYGNWIKF